MMLAYPTQSQKYVDMTLETAAKIEGPEGEPLLQELSDRVNLIRPEQERFRGWCDRADLLYYAETFTLGGADLWWYDPSSSTPGRAHVSVNTPATYVDVPSALQAVEPIENMLATDDTEEARSAASALERLYVAWKQDEEYDLKFHKACTVKSLYGRTAAKVYWDKDEDPPKPCVEIVEQPRNLWLGYQTSDYDDLEWAAYVQRMTPNSVMEEFGVEVDVRSYDGAAIPYVNINDTMSQISRPWLQYGVSRIEVWDYWYRAPKPGKRTKGTPVEMETWNVVIAGNAVVLGPTKYPEYGGDIPYVPLFNTFIPGLPDGRASLYDIEPLIREKFERITAGAQMISSATAGDYWQLTGPEAPSRTPQGLKPVRNTVISPGAGNRIETITPFIAQFQLEQYLTRIDREMATVSGLNDLLLGLAPSQVLSSSKAINALVANYESRISLPRKILYEWRRSVWELVLDVWVAKDDKVKAIVAAGGGVLDIIDPSLSPRDDMEQAVRAGNLVNAKLWSQRRGMDAVGVDDPETEQDMIREERTDASLFPADVQVMAQLMAAFQALGLQPPSSAQGIAEQQAASGQNDLRTALGGATPAGTEGSQGPEVQGETPPEAQVAGATPPEGALPFMTGPQAPGGQGPVGTAQTMIQGGQAKSRILTQQTLGRR